MPNLTHPGVYLTEVTLPQQPNVSSSQAVGAFVGVALQGPTNAPTLLNSWQDYVTYFGGFPASGTANDLSYAVYQFFANGGRQAYVLRVTATGSPAVSATTTLVDRAATPQNTLVFTALSPGAWGNSLSVQVLDRDAPNGRFDIAVFKSGNRVETFTDMHVSVTDPRYVLNIINSSSAGSVYVKVANVPSASTPPANMPSLNGGIAKSLTTGADGGVPTNADIQASFTLLNSIPGPVLLNIPGNSQTAVINSAIAYADPASGTGRGDVFVVVDTPLPTDTTVGGVANTVTYAQSLTTSSYAAVYYPWLMMVDPNAIGAQATRPTAPGGAVMGVIAHTDQVRGVFKAPAGIATGGLSGVIAACGSISSTYSLQNTDLDTLTAANVNAIKFVPGAGFTVWGARTLFKSGITRYVSARRTLIYLKQALTQATSYAVFENNDANLWTSLTTVCQRIVSNLWMQGGLAGSTATQAYYVLCDGSINTPQVIAGGEVRVQVGVALQYPAEFITITLTQFDGGSSVTDTANVSA
jgi:phage tail sheath protein FI